MINYNVIEKITWLFAFLKSNQISLIAGGFAIYFAYMKLSNKIGISYSRSLGQIYGETISNIVIFNKRDRVYLIDELIVITKDFSISLKKFDIPLTIKPYESVSIEIEQVSKWINQKGEQVNLTFDIDDDIIFKIFLSGGKSFNCTIISRSVGIAHTTLSRSVSTFNNIVLTDRMKFIITNFKNGKVNNIVILKNGMIENNDSFGYYNYIPPEDNNPDKIQKLIVELGFHQVWSNYYLYEIDDYLQVNEIFRKLNVMNLLGEEIPKSS